MDGNSEVVFDELKLREVITKGLLDFDGWTSLISEIERTYPDDIEKITLVYDSFLSKFPLCHGYWRKYASHKTRLSTVDCIIKVFERAVQSATYSVGVWADYCSFGISVLDDPVDVRRLFQRGMSFVRKDYLSHTLWDKYIEFEFHQQQWSSLAHVYIEALRFPTKKLHCYYDSFKKLVDVCKEEMGCQVDCVSDVLPEATSNGDAISSYSNDEISLIIRDLVDSSCRSHQSKALEKYLCIGEQFYKESCQLDAKINSFEECIQRTYFHVEPLDDVQIENWHHYLDFVERQGDFDWAVKLYERCLIPCANYPEFWMRYAEFMEMKGGREIANFALDRATQVFLKSVAVIHLFNAWFKEKIKDSVSARAAFLQLNADSDSDFVDNVIKAANMEKRLGNFDAASNTYKMAIEKAAEKQKLQMLPILYIHLSRLNYKITGSIDAAKDALMQGIKHVPHCKLLLEELIKFALLHGDARNLNVLDSIIAEEISAGLDASQGLIAKDREDLSNLYLEFVDLCGTIDDVTKTWNRHMKLFPHTVRTTSLYEHPAPSTACLRIGIDRRLDNLAHPSGDCSSDHPDNFLIQDQEASLPEKQDKLACQALPDQFQSEFNGTVQDRLQKSPAPRLLGKPEDSTPEPDASNVDLAHEFGTGTEPKEASQEHRRTSDNQEEHDHGSEDDMNQLSLVHLSLNPQDNEALDLAATISHEHGAPQNTSVSNGSVSDGVCKTNRSLSVSSPKGTQIADSTEESVGLSPLTRIPSPAPMRAHSLPPASPTNGGSRYPRSNPYRDRRGSSSGFRRRSHHQHHRERQGYQWEHHPKDEISPQMAASQSFPCHPVSSQNTQPQNQYEAIAAQGTAPHQWQMQNMGQQQVFAQPGISQTPLQSDVQQQSDAIQAYNQMWHYYYYQQQLVLQQQQQQQQQVQSQHLPQQLQQQQQQLMQLHHLQPQQQLQHLQQQSEQHDQQQLFQQQQYYLQQLQQQQWQSYHHLQLQQQQQLLQLQQQQLQQQQLSQQYVQSQQPQLQDQQVQQPKQQLELHQQVELQQQHSLYQQQEEHPHIIPSPVETRNSSCWQEGQGAAPVGTASASEPAMSRNLEEQSPQN